MEVSAPIRPTHLSFSDRRPYRKQGVIVSPSSFLPTLAGPSINGHGGSAEIISNGIRSNRTCTIQISNHLNVALTDPQFFCHDGGLYYPLPQIIAPGTREICVFSKDPSLSMGVIGVLSYRIGETSRRLAVMFSVAYNQLQYRNNFGLGLLPAISGEMEDLFDAMHDEPTFYIEKPGRIFALANDTVPVFTASENLQVRGTMSDRGKAIVKLNITPAMLCLTI